MIKKTLTALLIAGCAFALTSQAQTVDPKLEWATKVVALQQGADLDNLVAQLVNRTAQDLATGWAPRFDARVPKATAAPEPTEKSAKK